jgi:hypothetical protein
MVRLRPTTSDPGVGTVEEEQPSEPIGVLPREGLGDVGADVVTHYPKFLEVQSIDQSLQVFDQDIQRITFESGQIGLFGIAEPAEVGCDDVEAFSEWSYVFTPGKPELGPTVQQHQRKPGAMTDVVDLYAVSVEVPMIPSRLVHGNLFRITINAEPC